MNNPKISLIIPAYNEEKYIGECLDSVLKNADGKFFEIIVVDNASDDKTKEEAEKRTGVKVVYEAKKGLTRARERGRLEATGDIFAYFDADTRMPKGWFEKAEAEFLKDPNLACLSGPYIYYDIPGWQKFLVWCYWYFFSTIVYFITGYMITGGNFAMRKEVLEKMRGFDTSIEFYGEDTNIARRAHTFGKVKFKLSLPMYLSGRRLIQQGLWSAGFEYVKNYFSEVFVHHPITKEYKDFR